MSLNWLNSYKLRVFVGALGLYLLSSGISYLVFANTGKQINIQGQQPQQKQITISGPKTETCPLNGKKYTKQEKDIWGKRRPLAVMIENHEDARPLSGISYADVVYEAVAEGGVTRFLAVFYCGVAGQNVTIAPVRSARVYFIDWASEYGEKPIFAHVGGANTVCPQCPGGRKPRSTVDPRVDAYAKLTKLGWRVAGGNDFDTIFDSGFPLFKRDEGRLDKEVLPEHTMTMQTELAFQQAEERGFGAVGRDGKRWDEEFVAWKFADENPSSSPIEKISFSFWSGMPAYDVVWRYDKANNQYLRENGGQPFIDHENKQQITAKNVVVMFTKAFWSVDAEKHSYYQTVGSGKVLVFQNGRLIKGTWYKAGPTARTIFKDSKGREIEFVRGPIWIEVLENNTEVAY